MQNYVTISRWWRVMFVGFSVFYRSRKCRRFVPASRDTYLDNRDSSVFCRCDSSQTGSEHDRSRRRDHQLCRCSTSSSSLSRWSSDQEHQSRSPGQKYEKLFFRILKTCLVTKYLAPWYFDRNPVYIRAHIRSLIMQHFFRGFLPYPLWYLVLKIMIRCSSLQALPVPTDLVSKMLGNRVAVSPIVTIEPRRRKFHKPITLTIPVPKASQKGMLNQYGSSEAPTLRLLCSLAGKRKFPFGLAFLLSASSAWLS